MKKKIIMVLLLFSFRVQAQNHMDDFKVSVSDEYKGSIAPRQYVGRNGDQFYFTHSTMSLQLYGDIYNLNFEKSFSSEIVDEYNGKRTNFQDAVFFNGRLFIFFYGLKDKRVFYYYQEVDPQNFVAIGNPQLLSEKDLPSGALLYGMGQIGKFYSNPFAFMEDLRPPFEVLLSQDKSVMAIIIRWQGLEEDKDKYPVIAKVYNKNMELIWDRNLEFPLPRKDFNDYYTGVDSLGNLYIGGAIENQQHKKIPHIFFISENGAMVKKCNIGSIGHYSGYYTYENPADGYITCTGIVAEDENRVIVKGAWNYRISLRTMKIIEGSDLLFSQDLMSEYEKKKKIKNGGLIGFYPKLISGEMGTTYIMLESITPGSFNKSRTDVIVFCFRDNQKPWVKSFGYETASVVQHSTLAIRFGDKLHVFYNAEESDITSNGILNTAGQDEKSKSDGEVGVGVMSLHPDQTVRNKLLFTYDQLEGYELFTQPIDPSSSLGFEYGNQVFINEDNYKVVEIGRNFNSSVSRTKIKLVTITSN